MKLQKFLSQAGVASRRSAEELIAQKKVMVNGRIATIGTRIDPTKDEVRVGDTTISAQQTALVYYLVNKPKGIISTTSDELGRGNVLNLLPKTITSNYRLYPVGRLDKDSEGLLLLTNDGTLAQRLTHPRYEVAKTYRVLVDRKPTRKAIEHLRRGVLLKEGKTQPAQVTFESDDDDFYDPEVPRETWLLITIKEGRYHQVRRMLERVGYETLRLVRVAMGPFELSQLHRQPFVEVHPPFDL